MILECCYAGPVGEKVLAETTTADLDIRPRIIHELGQRRGRIILTASSGRQVALGTESVGDEKINGSIFTHYLLRGMTESGPYLIRDCFNWAWDRTRRASIKLGAFQEPQRFGDTNFDISLQESRRR